MINTNTSRVSSRIVSILFLTLFTLVFSLVNSTKAYAHAELEYSVPSINDSVSELADVSLTFNEEVLPISIEINSENLATPLNYSDEKTETITAFTPNTLTDPGTYFLTYQVVSKDSHVIAGVIPFSISSENSNYDSPLENSALLKAPPSQELPQESTFLLDRALELLSWLFFFIVLGLIVAGTTYSKATAFALIGLGVSSLRLIGLYDTFSTSLWKINETYSALLVFSSYILLLLVLILKNKKPAARKFKLSPSTGSKFTSNVLATALVVSVLLFASQAFYSGHFTNDKLFVSLNFVHLLGASLWTAALISILSNNSISNIIKSSRIATFSVILLIISTMIMFFVFVLEFLNSQWGWLIIAKIILVLGALLLGLLNNIKVRSLVKTPLNTVSSSLKYIKRKTITELVILTFVIFLAASLSLTSPYATNNTNSDTDLKMTAPSAAADSQLEENKEAPAIVEENPATPIELDITFDFDFTGKLVLSSTQKLTPIELELYIYSDGGDFIEPIQAEYDFASESNNLVGFNSYFTKHDDHLMASFLAPAGGNWTGVVIVQVDDFTSLEGEVSFTIE